MLHVCVQEMRALLNLSQNMLLNTALVVVICTPLVSFTIFSAAGARRGFYLAWV